MLTAVASSVAVPRGQAGPSGAPLGPDQEKSIEHKVFLLAGQTNVAGRGNAAHLTAEDASRLTAVRNRVSLTYWGGLSAFGLVGQLARRVHRAPLGPTRMDFGEGWLFGFQHGFGPELHYGLALAEAMPNVHIHLIKVAVPASSLWAHWNPWKFSMERVRKAMPEGYGMSCVSEGERMQRTTTEEPTVTVCGDDAPSEIDAHLFRLQRGEPARWAWPVDQSGNESFIWATPIPPVVPSTCCGWLDDDGTNADGVSGDGPVVCTKSPWCAMPLLPVALDAVRKEVDDFKATFSGVLWLHGELDGQLWGNTGMVEAADEYEDNLKSLIWKLRKDTGFKASVVTFCPRLAVKTPAEKQSPRMLRTVCGAMQNASKSIGGVTALMDEGEQAYADVAGLEVYENKQTSLGMPASSLKVLPRHCGLVGP